MDRRDMLRLMALGGLASVMAPLLEVCRAQGAKRSSDEKGNCVLIPEETAGPFTLDLVANPEYLRQDITDGKTGVPLVLELTLVDVNRGCAPIRNARVDVWHCDKDGVYSGFAGEETRGETFLRGIQHSDESGRVTFQTIYPGWYYGRATHIHFQVFLEDGRTVTSQVAFPEGVTRQIYRSPLYSGRGENTTVPTNAADFVFRSPAGALPRELCTLTGSVDGGYTAALNVGIAA
ncbi:MAG TPA: intradiol ring-cleavage dioxygenase [Candidatus Krumholzibacteria bacterium]